MINDKGARLLRTAMMRQAVLDWHCAEKTIRTGTRIDWRDKKGGFGVYTEVRRNPERIKAEVKKFFTRKWFGIIYWDFDFSGAEIFREMQKDGAGKAVKRLARSQEQELIERDGYDGRTA